MLSPDITASRVRMMAEAFAGQGSAQARRHATAASGLAAVVDFFTCSGVSDARRQHYDELAEAMAVVLNHDSCHFSLPGHLIIEDYHGYKITFSLPEEYNFADGVPIFVCKGNKTSMAIVDEDIYCSVCTALLIRQRYGLPLSATPLTDRGHINLKEAALSAADLSEAHLQKADLAGANLSNARLDETELQQANLASANLTFASLHDTNLENANLACADLRASKLAGTNLSRANLTDANLTGVKLEKVGLSGACLSGAVLDSMPLAGSLLCLPEVWDANTMDHDLNHFAHPESGSLLTMMDSIDQRYTKIKVKMACELILSLGNTDPSPVAPALLDVLSKAPWSTEPDIDAWLDLICRRFLRSANQTELVMPADSSAVNRRAVSLLRRHPELMLTFNSAFIQLVSHGIHAGNEADRENMIQLYDCYLTREEIRPWTKLDIFGDYSGKPDWTNNHADNYILFSYQSAGYVMLLSQNTLRGMLEGNLLRPVWDRFYLYNSQAEELAPAQYAPETLFRQHFPLFFPAYQKADRKANFHKLIDLLNLAELHETFIAASRQKKSLIKLADTKSQQQLWQIFATVLDYSVLTDGYSLKEEHYDQIIKAYDLTFASNTVKAKTLLCFAAIFTKYSSRAIFGTEHESPTVLRFYAWALMARAYALDQAIFNKKNKGNNFNDWRIHQLDLDGELNCGADLSSSMISHIWKNFPDVLVKIMPPAWY